MTMLLATWLLITPCKTFYCPERPPRPRPTPTPVIIMPEGRH